MTVPALFIIIVTGIIIGFIANSIMEPIGMRLLYLIFLGMLGSFISYFLFTLLGVADLGLLAEILACVVGASLLILLYAC